MNNFVPVDFAMTSIIDGKATAVLQSKAYPRALTVLNIAFSERVRFDVYVGGIANSNRISGHPNGDVNDGMFAHPIHIPGGHSVFVVWDSSTGTGSVRAQFQPIGRY